MTAREATQYAEAVLAETREKLDAASRERADLHVTIASLRAQLASLTLERDALLAERDQQTERDMERYGDKE